MLTNVDVSSVLFGEPLYLWLLLVPATLLPLSAWRAMRRRQDARRFRQHRQVPIAERLGALGAWPFWLCIVVALSLVVLALARPQAPVARVRTAGIDLIVLQDGSASMHVRDVLPDRWQRSMQFLRVLTESLRWKDDRIAMALFARIAAPQVRLTRDPNTFFFFLDHLNRESPFPLSDDTTWDTNIELGIYWGTRLVEKDQELHGRSPNAKAFVLVSDGQAWTGEIDRALQLARARDIPVFAVGVGTGTGGFIPEPPREVSAKAGAVAPPAPSPLYSVLDRASLLTIATAAGGQYFDLGRRSDRETASTIVEAVRRRAGSRGVDQITEELYWPLLVAAACLVMASALFLHEREELWLQALGAGAALVFSWMAIR